MCAATILLLFLKAAKIFYDTQRKQGGFETRPFIVRILRAPSAALRHASYAPLKIGVEAALTTDL
jgi:hypothetical protein